MSRMKSDTSALTTNSLLILRRPPNALRLSAPAAAMTWLRRSAKGRLMWMQSRSNPAIAFLGNRYHPERPYDDPRVTLEINDARNFFRNAHQLYDLIIYGVLDSHTALSHASNLRVDLDVYTREGIKEAFALLKPGGVLSISFALPNEFIGIQTPSHYEGSTRRRKTSGRSSALRFADHHRIHRAKGKGCRSARCQSL